MDSIRPSEEILADLQALEAQVDLDRVESLLRELTAAVDGLDDLAVAKYREAAVQKLDGKVRAPATLVDAAFAALRSQRDQPSPGDALDLTTPEPWPEAVNGSDLLDEIASAVTRYIVLSPHAVVAVALWAVHAHVFEAGWITPRLAICSPVKRCAKTLLLEILEHLVPKPLNVSSITAAAVFRGVEALRPTLLIDEADTFLADKDDLRGILNCGHRRNGRVVRTAGDKHELQTFSTFAPVAIAMIGRLPDTLADRSISIPMRRKRRDERVETFRADRAGSLEELRRKVTRWALDHFDQLAAADPEVPSQLHDREADNWRLPLAIADVAGGEWPARAREAAVALSASAAPGDQDTGGVLLLGDLREIFDADGAPALFTDQLLKRLRGAEERPWAEWRNDKPLTSRQMAALLRPFEIRPVQIRIGDRSSKGYRREAFEDAFARYLPPLDPKHPKQVNGISNLRGITIRNRKGHVSDREEPKVPATTEDVSDVSDRDEDPDTEGASAAPSEGEVKPSVDEVSV